MLPGTQKKELSSYLFQTSTLGADKSHAVAVVDVGGDGSHAVPSLGVESVTGHQLRPTEGLIDVQTAEGVIDGHRLQHRGGREDEAERKKREVLNYRVTCQTCWNLTRLLLLFSVTQDQDFSHIYVLQGGQPAFICLPLSKIT